MNPGDVLIPCPFCEGMIRLAPCKGLYKCDQCGSLVVAHKEPK